MQARDSCPYDYFLRSSRGEREHLTYTPLQTVLFDVRLGQLPNVTSYAHYTVACTLAQCLGAYRSSSLSLVARNRRELHLS